MLFNILLELVLPWWSQLSANGINVVLAKLGQDDASDKGQRFLSAPPAILFQPLKYINTPKKTGLIGKTMAW